MAIGYAVTVMFFRTTNNELLGKGLPVVAAAAVVSTVVCASPLPLSTAPVEVSFPCLTVPRLKKKSNSILSVYATCNEVPKKSFSGNNVSLMNMRTIWIRSAKHVTSDHARLGTLPHLFSIHWDKIQVGHTARCLLSSINVLLVSNLIPFLQWCSESASTSAE